MIAESKGRELFIVGNSVSGWTGIRYLEEWTGIAKMFDITTGYFEPIVLADADEGELQVIAELIEVLEN